MGSLSDKVRKAKFNASINEVDIAAGQTVYRNAKTGKVNLTMGEERNAKKTIAPRMTQDRNKTLARGEAMLKRETKKAAAKRAAIAVGNAPASKKSKASKSVTGEKAAEAMRKRTSPRGVKKYEKGASKALDKKYPGLYKKSK